MKTAMINGSPKAANSASGYLIDEICKLFPKSSEISQFSANQLEKPEENLATLFSCDQWVFVFPLYVDAVPAHLLRLLIRLEEYALQNSIKQIFVYAVVNCGFYEAKQNRTALEVISHFCSHAGLTWANGIGIGCGGFVGNSPEMPMTFFLKKPIYTCLVQFTTALAGQQRLSENQYVEPKMPRFIYKFFGEHEWKQSAKSNHLQVKEIYRKI